MRTKWFPVVSMVAGGMFKSLLIVLWKEFGTPEVLGLLTTFDPGALLFAECGIAAVFDQRHLAPTPNEAALFEILLVIGFALECLVVGFLIRWLVFRLPFFSDKRVERA